MEVEMNRSNLLKLNYWHKKGDINYWHREDGPAKIYDNGEEYWYYYNMRYDSFKEMHLNLFLAYCKWEYKKYGN